MSVRRCVLTAIAGTLLGVPGCLSIERLDYVPRHSDAGASDGGPALDSSAVRPCRACVAEEGGPCRSVFQACENDAKCLGASNCAIDKGCLGITELQARIACAVPCLQGAGIVGNTDRSLGLALDVNLCAVEKCSTACGGAP